MEGGRPRVTCPHYPEPQRSQILDYLFKPSFGAAVHILKVEIGGDAQSTEGTEASHMHTRDEERYDRGYEWSAQHSHQQHIYPPSIHDPALIVLLTRVCRVTVRWIMREAKARNPELKLYGLPWGFPGWVAEGGSFGLTNSTVEYVVKWLTGARTHHGLDIDYVGVWNEKQLGTRSRQYMVDLHAALRAANLSTVIVGVDDCCPPWGICPDLAADPEWLSVVGRVGGHYPGTYTPPACAALPISKWASEESIGVYTDGPHWSREINRNYQNGNITASIAWNLIAASTTQPHTHVDTASQSSEALCLTSALLCVV